MDMKLPLKWEKELVMLLSLNNWRGVKLIGRVKGTY